MSPEQAGGDGEAIDERADVFGLASILCEILTSLPAYTGPTPAAILRKAMRGDTADALRRLDNCGADAELVALARHCLTAEAEQRPRNAGEVARHMTAYLSGVQERLRAAERARAAEEARGEEARATAAAAERARAAEESRAEEARAAAIASDGRARAERRARRMTVGLAASVLFAGALGAAGWTWVERDRVARVATRSAQVNTALQEATGLRGQAQGAAVGDLVPWTKALAAADKARDLLEPGLDSALRRQVDAQLAAITSE
jgi:serine/threonine-protein kinase